MKKWKIGIAIYLLGCVVAYNINKRNEINFNNYLKREYPEIERDTEVWSIKDRNNAILVSIGSWFTAIAEGGVYLMQGKYRGEDKIKANW